MTLGAHLSDTFHRHRRPHESIHQDAPLVMHRLKKPRIRARRPQRRPQRPLLEIDRLAADEIRGRNRHRNPQLFKCSDVQESLGIKLQALIRRQPQPRKSPLPEDAKAQRSRPLGYLLERQARWQMQSPPAPRRCCRRCNRWVCGSVRARAEHPNGDSSRKPAAERQSHFGPGRNPRCRRAFCVGEFAHARQRRLQPCH